MGQPGTACLPGAWVGTEPLPCSLERAVGWEGGLRWGFPALRCSPGAARLPGPAVVL